MSDSDNEFESEETEVFDTVKGSMKKEQIPLSAKTPIEIALDSFSSELSKIANETGMTPVQIDQYKQGLNKYPIVRTLNMTMLANAVNFMYVLLINQANLTVLIFDLVGQINQLDSSNSIKSYYDQTIE
jgi:hypothetical protein